MPSGLCCAFPSQISFTRKYASRLKLIDIFTHYFVPYNHRPELLLVSFIPSLQHFPTQVLLVLKIVSTKNKDGCSFGTSIYYVRIYRLTPASFCQALERYYIFASLILAQVYLLVVGRKTLRVVWTHIIWPENRKKTIFNFLFYFELNIYNFKLFEILTFGR